MFVALCFLTLISVAVAMLDVFPNQATQWAAFLGVAFVKAALVVCYFMHLRWEKYWKYFMTMPALILGIALAISLIPDIGMRSQAYSRQRMEAGPDADAFEEVGNSMPDAKE